MLCGNADFELESTACFLRHSSSDITDIFGYLLVLAGDLDFVVYPTYDVGIVAMLFLDFVIGEEHPPFAD
jgi:hypothetical protein